MLTISKPMGASAAVKYHFGEHGKNDYYTQTAGTWYGKGAEALGLTGTVTEKEFAAISAGINPANGKRLIQAKTKNGELQHVAGVDMTMSIPKSASILSLGDPKINEILEIAKKRTLDAAEKYAAQCRYVDPETGKQVPVNSGNLVIGQFHHMTSRENEPQNHWHCFIMNMTQRADGKWVALHNKELYNMQRALGRIFDNELVYELRKAGYEIQITDVEKGNWEIVGVSKELIDEMSTRAKQCEAMYEELRKDPKNAHKTDAQLRDEANLITRKDKEEVNHDILKADWDERFQKYGYTAASLAEEITSKRDLELARREAELAAGIIPVSHEHVSVAIDRGAEMAHMSESAFTAGQLFDNAMKPVLGDHSLPEYEAELAAGGQIVSLGYYTDHKGNRTEYFATPEMIRQEQWMVDTTMQLKGTFTPSEAVTVERCEAFLARREEEGWIYSPSQRACFIEIMTGKDGVLLNPGYAGTGKTTLREAVQAFNEQLKAAGDPQHRVLGAGFTGKAAKELADRGVAASTIDSFLRKDLRVRDSEGFREVQAVAQTTDPLLTSEVVVTDGKTPEEEVPGKIYLNRRDRYEVLVDEASMLSSQHLYKIMERVVELREQGVQVKMTLSGDHRQAVAIGAGRMFYELQRLTDTAKVGLTDIIRQKAGTYAYQVATTLYREDIDAETRIKKVVEILAENGMVSEIADRDALIRQSAQDYFDLIEGKGSGFIVTVTNQERKDLNAAVRQMRVNRGIIEQGETFQILTAAPGLTGNKILAVDNYKVGQQIVYTGEIDEQGKVVKEPVRAGRPQPGSTGELVHVDPAENIMTVQYRNAQGQPYFCNHSIRADWNKLTAFVSEERQFAVGDKIVFLKNDTLLGVQNGTLGTILEIKNGLAVVQLGEKPGEGPIIRFALDGVGGKGGRIPYQYVDHAYAVTIEKSQGASVDVVITHAFVRALEKENNAASLAEALGKNVTPELFNSFNTTLTEEEKGWSQNFVFRLGKGPEHEVTASVILANVGIDGVDVQKAVMLEFADAKMIIDDDATREKMREAGMFFDDANGVWLTSLTNLKAQSILGPGHPLQTEYLDIAKSAVELHAQNLGVDLAETTVIDASASVAKAVGEGMTENKALVGLTRGKTVMKHNTNNIDGFIRNAAIASTKLSTLGEWDRRRGEDFITGAKDRAENPEWEVYTGEKKVAATPKQKMTAIFDDRVVSQGEEFSTEGTIANESLAPEEKPEGKNRGVLHRSLKGKDGEWVNEIGGVNVNGTLVHLRLAPSEVADFSGTIKKNGPGATEKVYQRVYDAKLQKELAGRSFLPEKVEAGLWATAKNEAVQRYLERNPAIRQGVMQGELLAYSDKTVLDGHDVTISVVQKGKGQRVVLTFEDKRIAGDQAARDRMKADGFRYDGQTWSAPLDKGQNLLGEAHPLRVMESPERQASIAEKSASAAAHNDKRGVIERTAETTYVQEKNKAIVGIRNVEQKPEFQAAQKAAREAAMAEVGVRAVISETRAGKLRIDELNGRGLQTNILDPLKQPSNLGEQIERRSHVAEAKAVEPPKEQQLAEDEKTAQKSHFKSRVRSFEEEGKTVRIREIKGVSAKGYDVHFSVSADKVLDLTKKDAPGKGTKAAKAYEGLLRKNLNDQLSQFQLPAATEQSIRAAAYKKAEDSYKKGHSDVVKAADRTLGEKEAQWRGKADLVGYQAETSVQMAKVGKEGGKVVALKFDRDLIKDDDARAKIKASGFSWNPEVKAYVAPLNSKAGQVSLKDAHPLKDATYKAAAAEHLSSTIKTHDKEGAVKKAADSFYVGLKADHVQKMPGIENAADYKRSLRIARVATMKALGAEVVIDKTAKGDIQVLRMTGEKGLQSHTFKPAQKQENTLTPEEAAREAERAAKWTKAFGPKESVKKVDGVDLKAEKAFEIPEAKGSVFATPVEKRRTSMNLPFAKGIETGASHKHDFTLGGTGVQWEREGLFKFGDRTAVRGYTDKGYGEFNTRIKKETRYIQTGENKGTVTTSKTVTNEGHSTTDRTIKRKDGTTIESKEYGYRTDIGYSLKQKDEVIKDASGEKIGRQKSTTHSFGGTVWGTKKIYSKDGTVKIVKWRGHYTFSGKLKIDKQTIDTETNKKVADRALKPLSERIVNAIAEKLATHAAKKDVNQQRAQDLASRAVEYEQGKGYDSNVKTHRVEQGGKYRQEDTITRKDGSVIKVLEKGETIGATKRSVRVETVEKGKDHGAKKITEVNRTGNLMTVTTKQVSRFGVIRDTEWHGIKQPNGKYATVGKRMVREYTHIPAAKEVLMSTKERVLDKFLQVADKIKGVTKSSEKTKSDRELSKGGMSL